MVDSHCHVADEAFEADLDEVVLRARQAGVSQALCVLAMEEPEERARASRVAAAWPDARFALGVHPHQAGSFAGRVKETIAALRGELLHLPGARAVGEIGLDYHYDLSPRDLQREVFSAQVELAGEMHLPVVVHTREAESDTRAILSSAKRGVRGVLHCYTGSIEMARWAVDLGLYVSLAGIVSFVNASDLRDVAKQVPLDRLLVETDSPYLAPVPFRGRRNEPAYVVEIARVLADVKGIQPLELDEAVTANFVQLFAP